MQITVNLDATSVNTLKQIAASSGISRNELILRAIGLAFPSGRSLALAHVRGPNDARPLALDLRSFDYGLAEIADNLNHEGICTSRGAKWNKVSVHRLLRKRAPRTRAAAGPIAPSQGFRDLDEFLRITTRGVLAIRSLFATTIRWNAEKAASLETAKSESEKSINELIVELSSLRSLIADLGRVRR